MFYKTLLQPDVVLGETILALTPERLQQYGLQGMVLDVDETLVPFRQSQISGELNQWFASIKPLVQLWLVSNNTSESRIRTIAESLEVPYLASALKPSRRKLRQALESMALPPQNVAMVGDRLFTDVLAGNRLGMFTIWVDPMQEDDMDPSAVTTPKQFIRNTEIWISQRLGVSLNTTPS
ncbi:MAG: YqeG family HAD IIIA-type phosphatase [Merismopedia sp. SIO2A8]|nr:YqeG family HAD IIIA-type phosphatase [Merismopedia sp. SIO2A8]